MEKDTSIKTPVCKIVVEYEGTTYIWDRGTQKVEARKVENITT